MNKTKISNISKYFIRISRERVEKSLRYSYRGRWNKKHEMIHHWIEHINTGSRQHKKLLSHMDTSGAACCADTLDNLKSLLKRLKMEPSLSGDLPNQENSKLKKEEPVESSELALKSGKQKVEGLSLIELFTPEQVKEHIRSLRQSVDQSKDEAEKNQAVENSTSEKFCQLCASSEKLTSEPPHIYCTTCETRIKKNEMYFTIRDGGTPRYFCIPCYDKFEGDTVCAEGTSIPKEKLEKEKNDEGPEERWVQCDKCEAWQHDICALYNWTRNEEEQGEYICPMCYINEVEQNERKPLPQSAILGAKDLPRTILSDHIEQRLFKRMKQERIERAKLQGYDEIPGAESLVVRVVSSVDKKVEVKSGFREFFREDNFPTEFPYKSKAILLFQKIEGVDVLLLALYVQEFGSECPFPNQRCVYLAYLDSVKYFRPDIKSAYGEALRTFVYQEILISYLEYCKLRGFTSCYLWSCPPHKGVDYILYCHPEIQKTPNTKKLREWHLAWLRKAAKEEIAVKITNLYDHFFMQTDECRAKVTAARLPYFDGDYWPRKAEVIIQEINQDDDLSDVSQTASKDQLFMHKLRQYIYPIQEDFIVVHLQHCCTHCCTVMVTGNRWICRQCKNFQLCDGCYDAEQKREDIERHPVNHKDNHDFYLVEIDDIPVDTKDRDEVLESGDFEAAYKFLSFCEETDIRYDTLRRTKYSSMMLLDLLHLYFKRNCDACGLDIDNNQGYRCKGCNYDLCNACYNKEGTVNHPHKLTNLSALADQKAQNKEGTQHVL